MSYWKEPFRVQIDYTFERPDANGRFTVTDNLKGRKLKFGERSDGKGTAFFEFIGHNIGQVGYEMNLYEKNDDELIDCVFPEDLVMSEVFGMLIALTDMLNMGEIE